MHDTIPQPAIPAHDPGPVIAPAVAALEEAQLATLGQALADAIEYRQPAGICADCDGHPARLCSPHAADLDRADDYAALARELGMEEAGSC